MPDMGEDVMIITDAILDAATVAFKANGFDLRAVLESALAAIPLDAVTRDRCAEAVDVILHHAKAAHSESGYYGGAISALLSAVATIRALPAVITPIEDKMRDRCKEAVWGLYAAPQVNPHDDAKDDWQQGCEAAVAAIGAIPSAPDRPMHDLQPGESYTRQGIMHDLVLRQSRAELDARAAGYARQEAKKAIRSLPAAPGHLAQMPENAVDAVWKFIGCEPMAEAETASMRAWLADAFHPLSRKRAVVPPRPMPTVDAIARAICCPDGCRYSASHCLVGNFQHQATAVLALFGKGGA